MLPLPIALRRDCRQQYGLVKGVHRGVNDSFCLSPQHVAGDTATNCLPWEPTGATMHRALEFFQRAHQDVARDALAVGLAMGTPRVRDGQLARGSSQAPSRSATKVNSVGLALAATRAGKMLHAAANASWFADVRLGRYSLEVAGDKNGNLVMPCIVRRARCRSRGGTPSWVHAHALHCTSLHFTQSFGSHRVTPSYTEAHT
jgi:hypothetical protein